MPYFHVIIFTNVLHSFRYEPITFRQSYFVLTSTSRPQSRHIVLSHSLLYLSSSVSTKSFRNDVVIHICIVVYQDLPSLCHSHIGAYGHCGWCGCFCFNCRIEPTRNSELVWELQFFLSLFHLIRSSSSSFGRSVRIFPERFTLCTPRCECIFYMSVCVSVCERMALCVSHDFINWYPTCKIHIHFIRTHSIQHTLSTHTYKIVSTYLPIGRRIDRFHFRLRVFPNRLKHSSGSIIIRSLPRWYTREWRNLDRWKTFDWYIYGILKSKHVSNYEQLENFCRE